MPTPSGLSPFQAIHRVSPTELQIASDALDRALLRAIGLPEEVEVREFENAVFKIGEQIKSLAQDFSLSKLIGVLPGIVLDGAALWEKLEPKLKGKIERKEFITKVVRYIYRKNDIDIPFLFSPFEEMVEEMIINSIPDMLDNLEEKIEELINKIKNIFK